MVPFKPLFQLPLCERYCRFSSFKSFQFRLFPFAQIEKPPQMKMFYFQCFKNIDISFILDQRLIWYHCQSDTSLDLWWINFKYVYLKWPDGNFLIFSLQRYLFFNLGPLFLLSLTLHFDEISGNNEINCFSLHRVEN